MSPISQKGDAVCLFVRVQPRSSKSGIAGMYGEQIKICLKSAPVENAANKECCELLAKALGVPRSSVSVMNGASSRSKVLKVEGVTPADVREALSSVLGDETECGA
ncbi:DUF167 domain-containing protein [Chlorobaculum sp. MV4-Y]|jgi:uncharacterized protein (TIGR00251 family)|uniref:DUF167 domain-containing protein n=1 Tax=Chlorobaculum sp. MV4-Y TaxID=2976335 RepID=UPI0021AE918C|nr:DUF167 domain-containing protein [Chlorobaculum sp. MV4-Y]UWX57249.1 DUF167 domain-containing protein [Chlorobaculum sp. MV4-Y]